MPDYVETPEWAWPAARAALVRGPEHDIYEGDVYYVTTPVGEARIPARIMALVPAEQHEKFLAYEAAAFAEGHE